MITGLWGKKIGMTQVFVDDKVIPVTALDAGRWLVTQVKNTERDGYTAVQVGCVKNRYAGESFSRSWLKQSQKYFSTLREIRNNASLADAVSVGQSIDCSEVVAVGDKVDLFGQTIGRGFAGVVKRYRFGGPPGSHGSTMGNKPGSIGFMTSEGKVIKGKKLPGHMGCARRVMQNLEIVAVEKDRNLILVKGSVPGKSGSFVFMQKRAG